jgi:hypothetical protein
MSALDDASRDGFDALFMRPLPFFSRCDAYLRVPYGSQQLRAWTAPGAVLSRSNVLPTLDPHHSLARYVHACLARAYTDRARLVTVRIEASAPAPAAASGKKQSAAAGAGKPYTVWMCARVRLRRPISGLRVLCCAEQTFAIVIGLALDPALVCTSTRAVALCCVCVL